VHPFCPNVVDAAAAALAIRSLYSPASTGFVSPQAAGLIAARSRSDGPLDVTSLVGSGELLLIRGSSRQAGGTFSGSVLKSTAAAGPVATSAAPAVKDVKTWIRFKVVEDATGTPIAGVTMFVTDPRGVEAEYTTRADGTIELHDVDPGVCAVRCERSGARVTQTLDFVTMGTVAGAGVGSTGSAWRILEIEEHKVQSGESIDSLARGIGMSWQDLSLFNWGTSVPAEINEHLVNDVGCTTLCPDGVNYAFSSSDTPGIMYLPREWSREGLATTQEHVIRVRATSGSKAVPAAATRLYFAIYYAVPDNAFKRAAETWAAEVRARDPAARTPGRVEVMLESVSTEADFKAAWQRIADRSHNGSTIAIEGHLLTHASKGSSEDGLEFRRGGGDDGTLTKEDIEDLPAVNWDSGEGRLTLAGCNTGLAEDRGWTPAEIFAKSQGVPTEGQTGYAYFSDSSSDYDEIDEDGTTSTTIYLWAFERGKNGAFGDGGRMPGRTFTP